MDSASCGGLYKSEDEFIVPWQGTEPNTNTNFFNCYREDKHQILPKDRYNQYFKNWQGPIHNVKLQAQILKVRETHSIHATSIQDVLNLMEFLGKENRQYPSRTTWINAVST